MTSWGMRLSIYIRMGLLATCCEQAVDLNGVLGSIFLKMVGDVVVVLATRVETAFQMATLGASLVT